MHFQLFTMILLHAITNTVDDFFVGTIVLELVSRIELHKILIILASDNQHA